VAGPLILARGLAAAAGCGATTTAPGGGQHGSPAGQAKVLIQRGRLPSGLAWQLAAFERAGRLGLDLESPSGHSYCGQVSYGANAGYSYYWAEGLGPAGFYVVATPGTLTDWTVTPLNAAGQKVAFRAF
jgi:hypothetical protein